MSNCDKKLAAKFAKTCGYNPKSGLCRMWYFNWDDIDRAATQLNVSKTTITTPVLKTGAKLYPAGLMNPNSGKGQHSLKETDFGNVYTHTATLTLQSTGETESEQIQNMVDGNTRVGVIIEGIDQGPTGAIPFRVLGFDSGMYVTADDWNSGENAGTTTLVVSSKEGMEEATRNKILLTSAGVEDVRTWVTTNEFTS